jgi:hypothetical protein
MGEHCTGVHLYWQQFGCLVAAGEIVAVDVNVHVDVVVDGDVDRDGVHRVVDVDSGCYADEAYSAAAGTTAAGCTFRSLHLMCRPSRRYAM